LSAKPWKIFNTDSNAFLTDEGADCTASTTASASSGLSSVGVICSKSCSAWVGVMFSSTAGLAMRRVAWLVSSSLVRVCATMPCMASVEASERALMVLSSSVWVSGLGWSVGVCRVVVTFGWVVVTGGTVDVVVGGFVVVVEVVLVVCIGGGSVVVGAGSGSVVVVVVVVSGTVEVVAGGT